MQETKLYSFIGGGYAGRVDFIYVDNNNHHVIGDFKSSKRPKTEEQIEGYKIQLSAYFVAYWQLFNVKPDRGEIWISNDEHPEPQIFIVTADEITKYYKEFVNRVKAYHKLHSITATDILAELNSHD